MLVLQKAFEVLVLSSEFIPFSLDLVLCFHGLIPVIQTLPVFLSKDEVLPAQSAQFPRIGRESGASVELRPRIVGQQCKGQVQDMHVAPLPVPPLSDTFAVAIQKPDQLTERTEGKKPLRLGGQNAVVSTVLSPSHWIPTFPGRPAGAVA